MTTCTPDERAKTLKQCARLRNRWIGYSALQLRVQYNKLPPIYVHDELTDGLRAEPGSFFDEIKVNFAAEFERHVDEGMRQRPGSEREAMRGLMAHTLCLRDLPAEGGKQ